MSLLKKGISIGPLIISNMVFVCKNCNHVDIISDKDYNPNIETKCPKCQSLMILKSTNTEPLPEDTPTKINDASDNLSKK